MPETENNSFKKYLQSQGKSKSTVTYYLYYLRDFISFLDGDNTEVENATGKEVMAYLHHLQKKGQANKTRSIRLGVIKLFFNWQVDRGQRSDNPVAHLKIRGSKKQKLYPILEPPQLENLYHSYQVPKENDPRAKKNWFKAYRLNRARNKVVLSLMVHQGLTTPEVNRLGLNDLKLKEGTIYIGGSRKSNERTLELKSRQIIELMEYTYQVRGELLKYQSGETQNLFLPVPPSGQTQVSGKDLGRLDWIWKGLTPELRKKHPEFINFKQVRASVITHWLKQYNLRKVQYMAGHKYINSTESYLVNQLEDLKEDIDQFHPIG